MGIVFRKKEIVSIHFGTQVIAAIYKGTKLIWMAARSCFGKGYWMNDKPWSNTEVWKNQKQ